MRHKVLRTVLVLFVLALAGACAACQTTGAKRSASASGAEVKANANAKQADPMDGLDKKMLILKDPRDMRLAVVRLSRNGFDEAHLMKLAREMTLGDLRRYVEANAQANRLVYQGGGLFRLDALRFVMGDAAIGQAAFFLRLKAFEVAGKEIDSVILEKLVLDAKDMTPAGGLALYLQLLEAKMTR